MKKPKMSGARWISSPSEETNSKTWTNNYRK